MWQKEENLLKKEILRAEETEKLYCFLFIMGFLIFNEFFIELFS